MSTTLENKIENELFNKYNVSFSVSFNENGFELFPDNYEKLADNLEVENDSDEFWNTLEKIRSEINLKYNI